LYIRFNTTDDTSSTTNNKDYISRGHSFDNLIFHVGLKQKKTIHIQTDTRFYMYKYTFTRD